MYAYKKTRQDGSTALQCIYPDLCCYSGFYSKDIVSIRVTERPDKPLPEDKRANVFIGWKNKPDSRPILIQESLLVFNMQFPCGYQVEMDRGFGQAICVDVEEIEHE